MLEVFYSLVWLMATGLVLYICKSLCPTPKNCAFFVCYASKKSKRNKTKTLPLLRKSLAQ